MFDDRLSSLHLTCTTGTFRELLLAACTLVVSSLVVHLVHESMSGTRSVAVEPQVVEISSDSEQSEHQKESDIDDLFEVRTAPQENDGGDSPKKKPPSPKRANEPDLLTPPNGETCIICLQPFDDVTVLSGCYHRFCFACILHWSQVTYSCPLCKRPLSYFMHDITSDGQYRTFYPKDIRSSHSRSTFLEKFPTEAHRRRKTIYTKSLTRLPLPKRRNAPAAAGDALQRVDQQAWGKRVEPWVKRELQAILSEEDVSLILLLVKSLIIKYGIAAPEVSSKMQDYLFENTSTFIRELEGFVTSGLAMEIYDRVVEYA